jgi:hypothetical protein
LFQENQTQEPEQGKALAIEPLTALTEAERKLALERFQRLRPFLDGEVALTRLAQSEQIPLRTAQRWVDLYRQYGLACLARKHRSDAGKRHLSEAIQQFIEGLALQKPPLTVSAIHRQVCSVAEERGENPPGYWQVRDVVDHLGSALTTLAHQGEKVYSQSFDLIYRREADAPNAIWQADHCLLDILLVREGQEPARPWLTVIGGIGMVLIGMPGLQKRMARYPQLYSRIGFVHEFRPLDAVEVHHLLQQNWAPLEVTLPSQGLTDAEAISAIIRITGGNFRLLHRLLAQVARIAEINQMSTITLQVVEAARESLVIGAN